MVRAFPFFGCFYFPETISRRLFYFDKRQIRIIFSILNATPHTGCLFSGKTNSFGLPGLAFDFSSQVLLDNHWRDQIFIAICSNG
jgi:hypothetical protein